MPTRKTPLPRLARCLICGDELTLPVFDCPACATPHHTACWQWTGGCAIYGCSRGPRPICEEQRAEEIRRVSAAAARRPAWQINGHTAGPAPRPPSPPVTGATSHGVGVLIYL